MAWLEENVEDLQREMDQKKLEELHEVPIPPETEEKHLRQKASSPVLLQGNNHSLLSWTNEVGDNLKEKN